LAADSCASGVPLRLFPAEVDVWPIRFCGEKRPEVMTDSQDQVKYSKYSKFLTHNFLFHKKTDIYL
jgi:hypothetical protein